MATVAANRKTSDQFILAEILSVASFVFDSTPLVQKIVVGGDDAAACKASGCLLRLRLIPVLDRTKIVPFFGPLDIQIIHVNLTLRLKTLPFTQVSLQCFRLMCAQTRTNYRGIILKVNLKKLTFQVCSQTPELHLNT